MQRTRIDLEAVTDLNNLARAAYLAGRGKRRTREAAAFFADLEGNLNRLGAGIRDGTRPLGHYHPFTVWDPKRRIIHAPCFADRVLHQAVFALAGPVLERAMVDTSYACRPGRGPLAAVHRAQAAIRRYPWYVKVDIRGYFPSIDQVRLLALLTRRFKGAPFLDLLARIIAGYQTAPGKGLPIGTLASQWFANYYLDGLDRFLRERLRVLDHVRYMDDLLWWCPDRAAARASLREARDFAAEVCRLEVKDPPQVNRSRHGVGFLGFRILPGALRLSHRRRRSYQVRRRHWEQAYSAGRIGALDLQRAYAAVHGIIANADSRGFRIRNLARFPPVDA